MWDLTFYDETSGTAVRVQAKRLTLRDGAAIDQAQADLAKRENTDAEYLVLRNYPLLRYGTMASERALLSERPAFEENRLVIPDNAEWVPFDLTEDEYMNLDETVGQAWLAVVLARNPQRDPTYDMLKKKRLMGTPETTN